MNLEPSAELRDELLELYSNMVTVNLCAAPILRGNSFLSPRSELVLLNDHLSYLESRIGKVRDAARAELTRITKDPAYASPVD